jgi:cephalosporin hydroxylase
MNQELFDRFVWKHDRMLLDDLIFRLEHFRSNDWDGGEDYFLFFKTKELVDMYQVFFSHYPEIQPSRMFELGIFDGGSTVFWNELLHPNQLISIDITKRFDSPYFLHYIQSRSLSDHIKTFWGIDQADKNRLRSIVSSECEGKLDLVIDDESHLYEPTRASFEALFPLCVPGGLYIIEDWAWEHWGGEYSLPSHPWANEEPLTQLALQLIEATGTSTGPISSVTTYQGFVVIERGNIQFQNPFDFNLDNYIVRRPTFPSANFIPSKLVNRARRIFSKIFHP